jgi:tRNA nucleotidyltransferase (CCA-adding enzyme)
MEMQMTFRSWNHDKNSVVLVHLLENAGHPTRWVGGYVRDSLMGHRPKDVDLATSATPDIVSWILKVNGIQVIETGLQHGTVTAVMNGIGYEITTLRKDVQTDGRHAVVEYVSDWKEDAARRDFTFNAMSIDKWGNLFDYFGGEADLKNKIVRFVGDPNKRITEDYLRILRYLRFHSRYSFGMPFDPLIVDAIKANASGLSNISKERIWMEVSKIMSNRLCASYFNAFYSLNIAEHIGLPIPDNTNMYWFRTIDMENLNSVTKLSRIFPDEILQIAEDWKWSNEEKELAEFLIKDRPSVAWKHLLVFGAKRNHVIELLKFHGMIAGAHAAKHWEIPVFPLSGHDALKKGLTGQEIGVWLRTEKEKWFRNNFKLMDH